MQQQSGTVTGVGGGVMDLHDEYSLVASPRHPQAQKLLAFWNARAKDGIVIGRDVPSRSIASLLSSVMVCEPVGGRRDFRVRLAGASLRGRFGCDIKGKLMSELFPPDDFRHHLRATLAALAKDMPLIFDSRLTNGSVETLHVEVVVLPVLPADRGGKWALAGFFYFD
ncbi:MAG: PAS domain-containing protein [Alphaproteobacteria bacterium]|nr:PAS domain-containing protein [Alphaproteobacteria bacterium]MDE2629731.1 PAS domain-containing protein [Alphaproteobacteria bacterium]